MQTVPDDFPEQITIAYQGEAVVLEARRDWVDMQGEAHRQPFYGYELVCPKCHKPQTLSVRGHTLTLSGGLLTANPSLVCPYDCGWHVWLRHGVAQDC